MLCLQSGLDQLLTVETLDLCCVSEVYPVPGVGSLVLAGERNTVEQMTNRFLSVGSLVLAGVNRAFAGGILDTP